MNPQDIDARNRLEMRALMAISARTRSEVAQGTKHAGDMRLSYRSTLDDAQAAAREMFPRQVKAGADITPEGIVDLCARAALDLIQE